MKTKFSFLPLVLLLFAFCFNSILIAQEKGKVQKAENGLYLLKGFTPTFFYSENREERAQKIAEFTEEAIQFYQKEIGFTPKTVFYILAPEDWKQFAAPPMKEFYGFPHNIDSVHLALSSDDNPYWKSFVPPMDQLPPALAQQFKIAYGVGESEFSMKPFFDLLAIHEMCHSYTSQAGLNTQRHWMEELYVNIMQHTFVAEKHPELLPALETFPNMVVGGGSENVEFTSLTDFERLYKSMGMSPQNYGWYQCQFHSAAKNIYNAGGKQVWKDLWKVFKKYQNPMSDKEFVEILKKEVHESVANFYLNWAEITTSTKIN